MRGWEETDSTKNPPEELVVSPDDIIKIINEIPRYICYIYPGYITLYLYYYFQSLTLEDTTGKLLKSIAVSYFYVVMY